MSDPKISPLDALSEEDRKAVESAFEEMTIRDGFSPVSDLADLIDKWIGTVSHAEAGYDDMYEEYLYDLTGRDDLQEVIETSGKAGQALAAALKPIDETFRNSTVPSKIMLGRMSPEDGWWWGRAPKRMGEEMKAALDPQSFTKPESQDE